MKSVRYIFLLFFCAVIANPATAQLPELINNPQFRPDAKAAVDSIYNLNFSGADKAIASWKKKYPEHPLWALFDGMHFWWQVLSDLEDTSHDEQFYQMMKKADYQAGKLLHRQPDHADGLIIRAIANGYMARQYANREEWITSITYGRKAMNAHEYLMELQPGLNDLKLAEGLKLYYLAYIPEKYPIVKTVSWALPDGDRQKGLKLIEQAASEAVFARAEARYFLGNINYNYENNYDIAVKNFERLQTKYPRNNYYARILTKSYVKRQSHEKALKFINETLEQWKTKKLLFQKVLREELLTWKGRILQKRDQKEEALISFKEAFSKGEELPETDGRSFYVISGYWAGKILFDQQKFEQAKTYLKKVAGADAEPEYRERARDLLAKIS